MKKKTVMVMMAVLMAAGMVSAVNVQAGIEDKTLIVGFDAEYPPYGYMDENGDTQVLIWSLPRQCANWRGGSLRRNL